MGAVIFFLLIVAALLVCTPRGERKLALGSMLMVGAAIWVAVRINLHRILGDLLGNVIALAWDYREEILLACAAAVVLIVPVLMIYIALCDRVDRHGSAKARDVSRKTQGSLFPLVAVTGRLPRRHPLRRMGLR